MWARSVTGEEEQLEVGRGVVLGELGDHRREVAAGAVPCDRHGAAQRGLLPDPPVRCEGVLDPGGEGMLGCQAVVHRDDRDGQVVRNEAADGVRRVESAEHPAAPVEVGHGADRVLGVGVPVAAGRDRAGGARDAELFDAVDGQPLAEDVGLAVERPPGRLQGLFGEVARRHRVEQAQRHLHLGVEHVAIDRDGLAAQASLQPGGQGSEPSQDQLGQTVARGGAHAGSPRRGVSRREPARPPAQRAVGQR